MRQRRWRSTKKKREYIFFSLVLAAAVSAVIFSFVQFQGRKTPDRPDVIWSVSDGEKCRLKATADCSAGGDQMELARQIADLYDRNDFDSVKFTRDMGDMPQKIYVEVYQEREDAGENAPVFSFMYIPRTGEIILDEK